MDQGHRVVLPPSHGGLVSHSRPDIREDETGVRRQRAGRLVSYHPLFCCLPFFFSLSRATPRRCWLKISLVASAIHETPPSRACTNLAAVGAGRARTSLDFKFPPFFPVTAASQNALVMSFIYAHATFVSFARSFLIPIYSSTR